MLAFGSDESSLKGSSEPVIDMNDESAFPCLRTESPSVKKRSPKPRRPSARSHGHVGSSGGVLVVPMDCPTRFDVADDDIGYDSDPMFSDDLDVGAEYERIALGYHRLHSRKQHRRKAAASAARRRVLNSFATAASRTYAQTVVQSGVVSWQVRQADLAEWIDVVPEMASQLEASYLSKTNSDSNESSAVCQKQLRAERREQRRVYAACRSKGDKERHVRQTRDKKKRAHRGRQQPALVPLSTTAHASVEKSCVLPYTSSGAHKTVTSADSLTDPVIAACVSESEFDKTGKLIFQRAQYRGGHWSYLMPTSALYGLSCEHEIFRLTERPDRRVSVSVHHKLSHVVERAFQADPRSMVYIWSGSLRYSRRYGHYRSWAHTACDLSKGRVRTYGGPLRVQRSPVVKVSSRHDYAGPRFHMEDTMALERRVADRAAVRAHSRRQGSRRRPSPLSNVEAAMRHSLRSGVPLDSAAANVRERVLRSQAAAKCRRAMRALPSSVAKSSFVQTYRNSVLARAVVYPSEHDVEPQESVIRVDATKLRPTVDVSCWTPTQPVPTWSAVRNAVACSTDSSVEQQLSAAEKQLRVGGVSLPHMLSLVEAHEGHSRPCTPDELCMAACQPVCAVVIAAVARLHQDDEKIVTQCARRLVFLGADLALHMAVHSRCPRLMAAVEHRLAEQGTPWSVVREYSVPCVVRDEYARNGPLWLTRTTLLCEAARTGQLSLLRRMIESCTRVGSRVDGDVQRAMATAVSAALCQSAPAYGCAAALAALDASCLASEFCIPEGNQAAQRAMRALSRKWHPLERIPPLLPGASNASPERDPSGFALDALFGDDEDGSAAATTRAQLPGQYVTCTALHWAVLTSNETLVEFVISRYPKAVYSRVHAFDTPLELAVAVAPERVVLRLFDTWYSVLRQSPSADRVGRGLERGVVPQDRMYRVLYMCLIRHMSEAMACLLDHDPWMGAQTCELSLAAIYVDLVPSCNIVMLVTLLERGVSLHGLCNMSLMRLMEEYSVALRQWVMGEESQWRPWGGRLGCHIAGPPMKRPLDVRLYFHYRRVIHRAIFHICNEVSAVTRRLLRVKAMRHLPVDLLLIMAQYARTDTMLSRENMYEAYMDQFVPNELVLREHVPAGFLFAKRPLAHHAFQLCDLPSSLARCAVIRSFAWFRLGDVIAHKARSQWDDDIACSDEDDMWLHFRALF